MSLTMVIVKVSYRKIYVNRSWKVVKLLCE